MRKTLALILISTLVVGGCGAVRDSRLNPFNWFGRAQSGAPVDAASTNPLLPQRSGTSLLRRNQPYTGQPVEQITGLTIERMPGGAILRITAVAARQGSYEVRVSPDIVGSTGPEDEDIVVDGVLSYTLLAETPRRATPVGTAPSRSINAARFVTDDVLAQVRTIRVNGARNSMTVRR